MAQEQQAQNLDQAWVNLRPNEPLPGSSPFYVPSPPSPLAQFRRALLRDPGEPQRFFLAGFRGSGKSTQINQLAVDPELKQRFFIVKFSIYDTCDLYDISHVDILVSLAARLIDEARRQKVSISDAFSEELRAWGARTEERIREKAGSAAWQAEAGGEGGVGLPLIGRLFANVSGRIQKEDTTRRIVRETFQPQLTELLDKMNRLAGEIRQNTGKPVLALVDDTDKVGRESTLALFRDAYPALTTPTFHLLYTIREWSHFAKEFPETLRASTHMLPNLRLWRRGNRELPDKEGQKALEDFVEGRMSLGLIETNALKELTLRSGGVYRRLAELLREAIDHALEAHRPRIELGDVTYAVQQRRNLDIRVLNQQDLLNLCEVYRTNTFPNLLSLAELFELLIVLEYEDDQPPYQPWYDVNPALWDYASRLCPQ